MSFLLQVERSFSSDQLSMAEAEAGGHHGTAEEVTAMLNNVSGVLATATANGTDGGTAMATLQQEILQVMYTLIKMVQCLLSSILNTLRFETNM